MKRPRPICPKCGSIAVERYSNNGLSCDRCGHDGRSSEFYPDQPDVDWSDEHARKIGSYMPSRTIPLSDE